MTHGSTGKAALRVSQSSIWERSKSFSHFSFSALTQSHTYYARKCYNSHITYVSAVQNFAYICVFFCVAHRNPPIPLRSNFSELQKSKAKILWFNHLNVLCMCFIGRKEDGKKHQPPVTGLFYILRRKGAREIHGIRKDMFWEWRDFRGFITYYTCGGYVCTYFCAAGTWCVGAELYEVLEP